MGLAGKMLKNLGGALANNV